MRELTAIAGLAFLFVFGIAVLWGVHAGYREYNRYQNVAEAKNEIEINRKIIDQTEQKVAIEQQKAQVRIEEAHGISESQRIIDESLTDNYLTYLAIQAQMEMADSPNNTTIYIPSGNNAIPFVRGIE